MQATNHDRFEIGYRKVADLQPAERNARTHTDKQINQIMASIEEFGFVSAVLIDENDQLVAGHGRLIAAKRLRIETIPTIKIAHLTKAQKSALAIADNKIPLNAGWDETALSEILTEISVEIPDFALEITGFESPALEGLLNPVTKSDPADAFEETDGSPPISRPGDLWLLGDHKVLCGSALELESYRLLLGRESAQLVVTDPPYNVPIDGHVSGLGKAHHREFAMASGEMSEGEFTRFLSEVFGNIARYSVAGAVVMCFMDWRHIGETLAAGRAAFSSLLNLCVWNKTNAGMGSLYRSKHELCFVFQSGKGKHINNIELGRHGRYRTNVWDYAGANAFSRTRDADLADHPTVKPVLMIADAIKDCSKRGGIVLDPFGGSGTTLLAAERTGRVARLIELDPKFVDVTLKRWSKLKPAMEPILPATGQSLSQVTAERTTLGPVTQNEPTSTPSP